MNRRLDVDTGPTRHLDRGDRWLLAAAAVYAGGLILAALFVPAYRTSGAGGHTLNSSASLVQANGLRVLLPVSAPLVAVGVVGAVLVRRRRTGRLGGLVVPWVVVGVLGLVSVLGILTIGPFLLPVVAMLVALCGRNQTTLQGARRSG